MTQVSTSTSVAMNPTQQRILHFDSMGLAPSQIASIVGVTDGYISQLRKDESYKLALQEYKEAKHAEIIKAGASVEEQSKREAEELTTAKYTSLENKVLNAIESNLPYAEFPMLVNALKAISDRQERRQQRLDNKKAVLALHQNNNTTQNITMLVLPGHAVQQNAPTYEVNGNGQIVAINGNTISPLGSAGVKQLFASLPSQQPQEVLPLPLSQQEVQLPLLEPGDDF